MAMAPGEISATSVRWTKGESLLQHEGPGAPGTNRTCDPPLRRGMLYPLSYGGGESDCTEAASACI